MSDVTVLAVEGVQITVVEAAMGAQGPPGADGLEEAAVQAIAEFEAQKLRVDCDALVAANLDI